MEYRKLFNGSLFINDKGRVCRKNSNAFAVDVLTGKDVIPAVKDHVIPLKKDEASELIRVEKRYL